MKTLIKSITCGIMLLSSSVLYAEEAVMVEQVVGTNHFYLIDRAPENVDALVLESGGAIEVLKSGSALAYSSDPDFLTKLKSKEGIGNVYTEDSQELNTFVKSLNEQ